MQLLLVPDRELDMHLPEHWHAGDIMLSWYPCQEKTLQRHDLYVADECFMTGTGAEVVPVTKIDGRVIGNGQPGSTTRKFMEAFHRFVREG